jgi:hypothetical protein
MRRLSVFSLLAVFLFSSLAGAEILKSERDLIAIVNLSILKHGQWHYRYEEGRAIKKIMRELGGKYREVHLLKGSGANHDAFLATLASTEANPAVKAIDVIIYLHGHPGELGFVDTGFYPMDRLRDEVLALPNANERKLRVLYSDACYGASHMDDWVRAGFLAAAGSVGSDSNWSLDLEKFMVAWRKGKTFGKGIDQANSVWATKWMDKIENGNSTKLTKGAVEFKIDQAP